MSSQPVKISSSKIKDAIGSLCKFLTLSGITHISPETFRQAKFNKEDAIDPMLTLLGELLEFSTTSQPSKASPGYKKDLVYSVHSKMLLKQYSRAEFFHSLDFTNSKCYSSQELLIAVGWLIGTEDLLKKMVLKDMHRLPSYPDVTQKLEESRFCVKRVGDSCQAVNMEDRLNQLIWDIGKCQMVSKQLHWKQLEIIRLVHKIHSSTQGVCLTKDWFHLSPAEAFVLRFEPELQKHLGNLEKENRRLQMYYQWQEKEEIFWHWMESVTLSDTASTTHASPSVPSTSPEVKGTLLASEQSEALETLHMCLGKTLSSLAEKTQNHCVSTQRLELESSEGLNLEGDATNCDDVKSGELKIQMTVLPGRRPVDVMDFSSRFQFVPKGRKGSPSDRVNNSNYMTGLSSKDIKEEILALTKKLTSLKAALSDQRDTNKDACNDILTEVNGVICIPPITCNKM